MSSPSSPAREVTVVCPTYQEGSAIGPFLREVRAASASARCARVVEVVFVDDGSTDGTLEALTEAERTWESPRVRVVRRSVKGGTVSAQVAGFEQARTPIVVTMDADGQHPTEAIDRMVGAWSPEVDLVVASRYVPGGDVQWAEPRRGIISGGARAISRVVLPGARRLRDPLSGFFLARREWVTTLPPSPPGYKLLLYVLAMHPTATIREVPYRMGVRVAGESKLVQGVGFIPSFLRELLRYRRAADASRAGALRSPR